MLSFQVHKNLLRDKQPAITGSQIKAGLGTAVKIGATADTEIIPFSQPAYFPFLAGSIGTVNGLDPDKTDFLQGSNELIKRCSYDTEWDAPVWEYRLPSG